MEKQYNIFRVEKLLRSGLIAKAEAMVRKGLEQAPDDEKLLERLVDLCRQQGKYAEAREVCGKWLETAPDNPRPRYLSDWLTFSKPSNLLPENGARLPTPVYLKENFLPQVLHDELYLFALRTREEFIASPMAWGSGPSREKRVRADQRRSRQTVLPPELKEQFLRHVEKSLPEIRRQLSISPYPVGEYKEMLVLHSDGDYLVEHRDDYLSDEWLTAVYYFNGPRTNFSGGELVIFDAAVDEAFSPSSFSLLPFSDNRLVAFSGKCHHGVLPVHCSHHPFDSGRFSVVLWLVPAKEETQS